MAVDTRPEDLAEDVAADGTPARARVDARPAQERAESDLILDTLRACASTFGTERARFLRRLPTGEWQVHALQHGALMTHSADYAEIAMAWTVGLSRFPIRVTRPRVTTPDGENVRPIAVTTYFGIPVICADHFVGVIELAGNVSGDLVRTLEALNGAIERFGNRLTHDPSLRASQLIDPECECSIDGGCWWSDDVTLAADEWRLVAAINAPETLARIAERAGFELEQAIEIARNLVSRGVLAVRAATRPLGEHSEVSFDREALPTGD